MAALSADPVSILVPLKAPGAYLRECVTHCLQLDYPEFEVLVLPDGPFDPAEIFTGLPLDSREVRVIPTGPVGPAAKRDLGARLASGQILAFLDDDAYPSRDWLSNAARILQDPTIGAVGGPAVTPPGATMWEQASGAVFSSLLGGGSARFRYIPRPAADVDDLPSVNLLVRRDLFEVLGGFGSRYWPGEDSKLCLRILEAGRRLRYDPSVLVWHHRRPLFRGHLRQVAAYALHRGHFARQRDGNSRRPTYFLPSSALLGLVGAVPISLVSPLGRVVLLGVLVTYGLGLLASGLAAAAKERHPGVGLLVPGGIALTHVTYGLYFVKGLLTRELTR